LLRAWGNCYKEDVNRKFNSQWPVLHGGLGALGLVLFLSFELCALSFAARTPLAGSRPNIILIIADDMAWHDCGPYGNRAVRTPYLDRLAAEGMRFDRAFVTTSSCSPSRASMITGRYPHATDAEQLHWPLPAEQVTFVEKLRAAGYWTAAAGKWHLGEAIKERFDLVREADPSGFQLPTGKDGQPADTIRARGDQSGCAEWLPTLRARDPEKPFFLWLAALDPHRDYETNILARPHFQHDAQVPPYLPNVQDTRLDLALYYDEITRLDGFVGTILHELDRIGLADNTLIVFLSDNGRPFPREKTTLYDGGIRTPFLVRWPDRVPARSVCASLVSSVDLAPTFLELAGVPLLDTFQGISFVPLLADPGKSIQQHVFAERHWHDFEAWQRAVRSTRYKYIRNEFPDLPDTPPADALRSPTFRALQRLHDAGFLNEAQSHCFVTPRAPEELYDLETDPHELHNLADNPRHHALLMEMRILLNAWQTKTGDRPPKVRTPDEFDRETGRPLPARQRPRPSKQEMMEKLLGDPSPRKPSP
jgi:N-sulfoglucosamine sulfohydrolase